MTTMANNIALKPIPVHPTLRPIPMPSSWSTCNARENVQVSDASQRTPWDLSSCPQRCFLPPTSSKINVSVFEAHDAQSELYHTIFSSPDQLAQHLTRGTRPPLRIISISSPNSYKPLSITRVCMEHIAKCHGTSSLVSMCSAFGTAPQELDGRFSGIVHTAMHHGSKHLYYLHRSMERKNADQFVLRQSSVYHARTSESDFWILLHPHPATMLEQRLISFSRSRQPALRHFSDPMTIHGTIITAITTNWHIYTQHLANECSGKANHTFTMESLDEKSTTSSSLPRNFDLGFHELQQMRDLEDVIMSIPIVLNATVTLISEAERAVASSMTVEKVSRAGESGGVEGMRRSEEEEEEEKHLNFFKAQKAILEDIVSVVGVLQGRIRGLRGFTFPVQHKHS